jgi:hypothetical protein
MELKKQIILFCLIAVIEVPFNNLFSQVVQTKPTRQSSFEAFSQGNYEKAYAQFSELLMTYTKDPLYKYYSGVCLVKLNREPGEAANLLQEAIKGSGNVKTLPSDGLFYLGRAQQMSGKYSDATVSYDQYTDQVGKKTAKEMGVPEFLQQCNQRTGKIADSQIKPAVGRKNEKSDSILTGVKPALKQPIQKPPEKPVSAKVNMPETYDNILGEALEFQSKADSVTSIVNDQKKQLEKLSGTEKLALKLKINDNEKTAASFQFNADQKKHEAMLAMNHTSDTSLHPKDPVRQSDYKVVKDTNKKSDNRFVRPANKKPDTTQLAIPVVKNQTETFNMFEVLAKPVMDPKAKIVIDPPIPDGLIYRIQIAVFRNPVVPAYFKGLSPVNGFRIAGTDKTIYYVGLFRKSADAGKALATVKNKGFKDSFIVALSGNKSVSPDRAALLEKEWGKKPLFTIDKAVSADQADTITPTLIFRVEVIRSLKPVKDDVFEGIRKMADNRGLDIQTMEDGKFAYLVGKFITFETAAEYADLLKRNGYREAQVVAWLGKKEIPIETARHLFDNLK